MKEDKIPLITKFYSNLPSLSSIIRKHWSVLIEEDPRLKRVFPQPSVVAYRRGKNLKDLLVRAKVDTKRKSNRTVNGYFRCGRGFFNQCATCNLILENGIKSHKCNKTKETYQINSNVTCVSENVVRIWRRQVVPKLNRNFFKPSEITGVRLTSHFRKQWQNL